MVQKLFSTTLIIVDYTSNFPEIVKLCGITSKHLIDALKSIMARFGIPKIIFSDNAPRFSSAEFWSCAKFYNFQSKVQSMLIVEKLSKLRKG